MTTPKPLGVLVARSEPAVGDGQPGGADAEPGGAAHDLDGLAELRGDERLGVEVVDLAGDPDGVVGGVERPDRARCRCARRRTPSQKASLPTPLGATTPIPVTTTLRMTQPRSAFPHISRGAGSSRWSSHRLPAEIVRRAVGRMSALAQA